MRTEPMSIEQVIQENTKAVMALTAALLGQAKAPAAEVKKAETPKAESKPAATESAKPETAVEQPDVAAPEGPSFDEVAAFVTAFIKKVNVATPDVKNAGRDKALAILVPFIGEGKTLQAAKDDPAKLAKILAAFEAADTAV